MTVIPQTVIDGWHAQYGEGAALWKQYPEIPREPFLNLIARDKVIVLSVCLENTAPRQSGRPIYLATAGAPLAGKSTILEQYMAAHPKECAKMVRVDPDRYGILFMPNAYHGYLMSAGMVATAFDFQTAQRRAYDIARPASNFITLEILNEAVRQRRDIAHGTTMTGPHIQNLLSGLKKEGYQIDLLLCSAEDDMRAEAQEYRANVQGFYQSTPQEVASKGQEFPKKIRDYFELGDNLTLFWRDDYKENATKCAVYEHGRKTIIDPEAFERFVTKYERDRAALGQADKPVNLSAFCELEALYAQRFPTPAPAAPLGSLSPGF